MDDTASSFSSPRCVSSPTFTGAWPSCLGLQKELGSSIYIYFKILKLFRERRRKCRGFSLYGEDDERRLDMEENVFFKGTGGTDLIMTNGSNQQILEQTGIAPLFFLFNQFLSFIHSNIRGLCEAISKKKKKKKWRNERSQGQVFTPPAGPPTKFLLRFACV